MFIKHQDTENAVDVRSNPSKGTPRQCAIYIVTRLGNAKCAGLGFITRCQVLSYVHIEGVFNVGIAVLRGSNIQYFCSEVSHPHQEATVLVCVVVLLHTILWWEEQECFLLPHQIFFLFGCPGIRAKIIRIRNWRHLVSSGKMEEIKEIWGLCFLRFIYLSCCGSGTFTFQTDAS